MLRGGLTLLVILHHTAITYGASGGWFYREVETSLDSPQTIILSIFCAINQSFFMGLFFLLAGYFTPASIARRGARAFLVERFLRLGIPLLIFGYVLGPVTVALAATATGRDFWEVLRGLWLAGDFVWGPLWFVWALMLFAIVAVAWNRISSDNAISEFPTNRALAVSAFAVGAVAFLLRLIWPVGSEVAGLQLGFFSSYIFLFAAGYLAAKHKLLENVPVTATALWRKLALVAFPVLPVVAVAAEVIPALKGPMEGGFNIAALTWAFWEPVMAFGIILTLLPWSLRRFQVPSAFGVALSRRAYAIYVIHAPVLVAVSIGLRGLMLPPIAKFMLAGLLVSGICYVVAGLLLRVGPLRRIL